MSVGKSTTAPTTLYSFTFNPSLLTIPKRKQQVAEILKEAETYIWRIKEEMRCA